jgi:predicted DNA-binding transcriptional regulator AlpA
MEPHSSPRPQSPSIVLLTPQMVCKILSISRRTLRYWVKKHVVPEPLRIGPDGRNLRWHPTDIVEYLKTTRGHIGAQEALSQLPKGSGAGEVP